MKLHIFTPPNKQLKGVGIDEVDPSITIGQLKTNIIKSYPHLKSDDMSLMFDKSGGFSRIYEMDPMNRWYAGMIGDIYRITDDHVRYRKVIRGQVAKKAEKSKEGQATKKADKSKQDLVTYKNYYRAQDTIINMLRDRQNMEDGKMSAVDRYRKTEKEVNDIFNSNDLDLLNIGDKEMIVNRRGKRMFVYYLAKDNDTIASNRAAQFKELIQTYTDNAIELYNSSPYVVNKLKTPNINDPNSCRMIAEKIEIIVVYNHQNNAVPIYTKTTPVQYIQFFSVQELVISIPKHIDQPIFHLLDPSKKEERDEIRQMYSLNGMILRDPDMTLNHYGVKEGAKLLCI